MVTRVRVCNYVKFKARWNFPPVLKIVTHTVHAAEILAVLLMLLSVHVTSVLFLIRFNNFVMELHALTQVGRSYALLMFTISVEI